MSVADGYTRGLVELQLQPQGQLDLYGKLPLNEIAASP